MFCYQNVNIDFVYLLKSRVYVLSLLIFFNDIRVKKQLITHSYRFDYLQIDLSLPPVYLFL